jgi:hypothetical protein
MAVTLDEVHTRGIDLDIEWVLTLPFDIRIGDNYSTKKDYCSDT